MYSCKLTCKIGVIICLVLFTLVSYGAPFRFLKSVVSQPDGSQLTVYVSGDEFYNWIHDSEGYTIVQSEDGFYYYAQQQGSHLVASSYRVGQGNPAQWGLKKWLKEVPALQRSFRLKGRSSQQIPKVYAPHSGTLNNIVIFVSFKDDSEFTTPRTGYDKKFNDAGGPSLHHYYREVSYNKLKIVSSYFPACALSTNLSYKDEHNRGYFQPYNATSNPEGYTPGDDAAVRNREQQLLQRALEALKPEIETRLTPDALDADKDGYVDNVCFIIKGEADGWSDLLWAHRWSLFSVDVRLHNLRVYDYVFQPENQVEVRTLCHEMFHALGAPDLYHYSYDGLTPVGLWDMMEDSDAHMGAYMKWKYSNHTWISNIPEITCSGTYTLNALTNSINNCYKIKIPGSSEFFILEYRKTEGLYESSLPGSGLLVYRINPAVSEGNKNGPPDEVYIFRPGGTSATDGDITRAHFSLNEGRTAFTPTTNPHPFFSDGNSCDLNITDIGEAENSITFNVQGLSCGSIELDSKLTYQGDSVCRGEEAHLYIDLADKTGPLSYAWNAIPSGSFVIYGGTSSSPTIPTKKLTGGTYRVKVTVTDLGTTPNTVITDTVTFVVWNNPSFTILPSYADFCLENGEPQPITIKSQNNGDPTEGAPYTYLWECDRGQITSGQNTDSIHARVLEGCNQFILQVTDQHHCSVKDTAYLQGHHFNASISLLNSPECEKSALLATEIPYCPGCYCGECFLSCGCSPMFSVSWGPPNIVSGNGLTATTIPLKKTETVWVKIQDPAGCTATAYLTIPLPPCEPPKPELYLYSMNVCDYEMPQILQASYKEGIGPVSFNWIAPPSWGNPDAPSLIIPGGWTGCTSVTLEMTDHGFSTPKTISSSAQVCVYETPPDFSLYSDRLEGCVGEPVTISSDAIYVPNVNYNWFSPTGSIMGFSPVEANGILNQAQNIFVLEAESGYGRCRKTASIFIPAHEIQANISALPGGFDCNNMAGELTANGSYCTQNDPFTYYNWGPSEMLVQTPPYGPTVTTLPLSGPTVFSLEVRDIYGCMGFAQITLGGGICDAHIIGDTVCAAIDSSVSVYAHPSVIVAGGYPFVNWQSPSGLQFDNPNSYDPSVDVTGLPPGDYEITAQLQEGAITIFDTAIIRIAANPVVTLSTDSLKVVCLGDSIPLRASVTPSGEYSYYWLNGAYGNETDSVGKAVPAKAGESKFIVKVENRYHCEAYDTISLKGLPRVSLCGNAECNGANTYAGKINISNGLPPYTLYRDEALTEPVTNITWNNSRTVATIEGLNSGQAYRFYVGGSRLCETSSVEIYKECQCNTGAFLRTDSIGCNPDIEYINIHIEGWGALYYSFQLLGPDDTPVFIVEKDGHNRWTYPVPRIKAGRYRIVNFTGYSSSQDQQGCPGDIYGNATVTFPEELNIALSASKYYGCVGDSIELQASGTGTQIKTSWTTEKGGLLLSPDSLRTKAVLTGKENIFTFLADAGSGCIKQVSLSIPGHQVIAGEIQLQPEGGLRCEQEATLKASGYHCLQEGCNLTYHWEPADKLHSSNESSVTTRILEEKTRFCVTISDSLGCKDTADILLTVGICEIKVMGDTLCYGATEAHPFVLIKGGAPVISWKDPNHAGFVFDDPGSAFPTVNIAHLAPGTYPLEVTVDDGISTDIYHTAIQILPLPSVSLQATPTEACIGENISLQANVEPAGNYTYYWLDGAVGPEDSPSATGIIGTTGKNCFVAKIKSPFGCQGEDTTCVSGKAKAYACATTYCTGQERFSARIDISHAIPPYTIFTDQQLTIPAQDVVWDTTGNSAVIHNLTGDSIYHFYLNGPFLCTPLSVEVTDHCPCELPTRLCEAGMLMTTDSLNCTNLQDTIWIYLHAWGAERYSFRLLDPNGATVLTVSNDSANYWTYPVTAEHTGNYTIDGFQGLVLPFDACPGKIFGKALVIFPEQTKIEAGQDKYICLGESVSLSANGNACSFQWNNGIENGQPFTPQQTTTYVVEGTAENGCPAADSITVFVEEPVIITYQSPDITTEKGQNAQFHIQTLSTSPVSYQWQKQNPKGIWERLSDGGNTPAISGTSSQHILLQNLPLSWNNTFLRCIASNRCGSDTAYFNLRINGCTEGGEISLVMEEGIIPDSIEGNYIHGWFCRGVRIGVRAVVNGVHIPKDATFEWTVDGLPVEYSKSEYITWIPAMWEDDIVLKVCIRSNEFCEPLCAPHLRLKSRPFEKPALKLVTSVDPTRTFCPGESVLLKAEASGFGLHPEFRWYNDIFFLGTGREQTLQMPDQDEWIRLIAKVSDEVCTENHLLEDTAFLRLKQEAIPTLRINVRPDSVVCTGETVYLEAEWNNAGNSPEISWQADIRDIGKGKNVSFVMSDKDTWIRCILQPSNDICYSGKTVEAILPIRLLPDNARVTLTSDMDRRNPQEKITFRAQVENVRPPFTYNWYVNHLLSTTHSQEFSCIPTEGDKITCVVSGERTCQKEITSETLTVSYGTYSRDTLIRIYQGESIRHLNLARPTEKEVRFIVEEKPLYGTASLSEKGIFSYIPDKDFTGSDLLKYRIENLKHEKIAEGNVYISVSDKERYWIPNIITPNGDGVNDVWIIDWINDYPGNTVLIFNRRSQLVFSAVNYQNNFDGTGEGDGYVAHIRLPNGIYTYVIDLGNNIKLKSWLEIRR